MSYNQNMKIAMLISGGGTTAERIIQETKGGRLAGITPALVIVSKPDCKGIERVRNAGIAPENIVVLEKKNFTTAEEFGEAIIAECHARNVDFIGQYGWLVMTPENVCNEYKGQIVNQHPGPLDPGGNGDFGGAGMYGIRVHEARLQFVRKVNRDFWTEATAHFVTPIFDEGAIIKRKQVSILPEDTAETLQARVLPVEYEVQIETLRVLSEGGLSSRGTREVSPRELASARETPLVLRGEEEILAECKADAIKKYPNG